MKRPFALIGFLVLVLGGGMIIGFISQPGEWYAALEKPPFNPPNWIFAPVWSSLYVLIAIAGYRTWVSYPASSAMRLWIVQLVLNFLWTPIFFTLHLPGAALVVLLLMLASIVGFIAASGPQDRASALLFLPYALWVAFAGALNAAIWWLN
ncbi:MAG: tryptophan-rich sensory protein [Rhizobiaceae bacterium]|nr:tryptophan-rich sensory protein [Rhizobiaceae bacterium]